MCNVLTKHRNLSVCLCVWVCVCVCRQPEQQAIKGKWVEPHLSVWRGHSGANCLCIFANTYSFLWVLAFHVFICERLRIFVLFFSLHIHPCHNMCVCVCVSWAVVVSWADILSHCDFPPNLCTHSCIGHTASPHLSYFSALSLSNDNYLSMAGAVHLEMKMDWISSGRCVVVATCNYTVRTIEPPLNETLNLTHLHPCWLQGLLVWVDSHHVVLNSKWKARWSVED